MPNGLLYLYSLDRSISSTRGVWLFLLLPCFIEIPAFNANRVLRRLIRVNTVCQCPFYRTLGLNGLKINLGLFGLFIYIYRIEYSNRGQYITIGINFISEDFVEVLTPANHSQTA